MSEEIDLLKKASSPFYKIRPDKLIRLLEGTYSRKKEQVIRYDKDAHNALIFMVTDLEETSGVWTKFGLQGRARQNQI